MSNSIARPRYARISRDVASLIQNHAIKKAPVDIVKLAEKCGAVVAYENFGDEISGLVFRKGEKFVIGVNGEQSESRKRFTVAHELGHILLHDLPDVHIDRNFTVMFRSSESSLAKNVLEIEANAFAAELLMPEAFLLKDLRNVSLDIEDGRQVDELANKYNVSSQAMTYRLQNLSLRNRLVA